MKVSNKAPKIKCFWLPFNWKLEFVLHGNCWYFTVELWKGLDTINDWHSYQFSFGVESSWFALDRKHKHVYTLWTFAVQRVKPGKHTWIRKSYDYNKVHDAAWDWYFNKYIINQDKPERLGMRV